MPVFLTDCNVLPYHDDWSKDDLWVWHTVGITEALIPFYSPWIGTNVSSTQNKFHEQLHAELPRKWKSSKS